MSACRLRCGKDGPCHCSLVVSGACMLGSRSILLSVSSREAMQSLSTECSPSRPGLKNSPRLDLQRPDTNRQIITRPMKHGSVMIANHISQVKPESGSSSMGATIFVPSYSIMGASNVAVVLVVVLVPVNAFTPRKSRPSLTAPPLSMLHSKSAAGVSPER